MTKKTVLSLGVAAAMLLSGVAQAANYCVDQFTDGTGNAADCPADGSCAGTCSLRDAVLAANAHAGADVIKVKAGTYTLAGTTGDRNEDAAAKGDLDITDDVRIEGVSAKATTINGNHLDRIFDVRGLHTVAIEKLRLTNGEPGSAGGAILSLGHLTLDGVLLESNAAAGNGGGVAVGNAGTFTVENSLLRGNGAVNGGGVGCDGTGADIDMQNATLSGNEATGKGGGLFCNSRQVRLSSVTIANNVADSDGDGGAGSGQDGGGLWVNTSGTFRNVVLADNRDDSLSGDNHPDCSTDSGGWYQAASGYNVVARKEGCFVFGGFTRTSDATGTIAAPLNAKLGALGDHGGTLKTHALLAGSPLLDAGDPAGCKSFDGSATLDADQRGFDRPVGDACDVGAFEQGDCGDGAVDVGEACDDGNAVETDACLSTCEDASCGDGFIESGVEECDDGNVEDGDGCSSECTIEAPEEGTTGGATTGDTAGDTTGGTTSGETEEPTSGGCSLVRR